MFATVDYLQEKTVQVINNTALSTSPLNRNFLKFHSNLLKGLRIDLETFLGLAMPNQYCQTIFKRKCNAVIFLR